MFYSKIIKKGYVTLLAVLVVSVVSVSITISLLLLGLGSSRTGFSLEQSGKAKSLANACAEEALQQIKSVDFLGSDDLSMPFGSCDYTVVNNGGESRLINAVGSADDTIRRVSITISQINPFINITGWQEVADF